MLPRSLFKQRIPDTNECTSHRVDKLPNERKGAKPISRKDKGAARRLVITMLSFWPVKIRAPGQSVSGTSSDWEFEHHYQPCQQRINLHLSD